MKSILYALIAVMIFGIFATGLINKPNPKQQILIQSTENKVTSDELIRSAEIIIRRLKRFSNEAFEVVTVAENNQIQITLNDQWDIEIARRLIIQKGQLEFYETLSGEDIHKLLLNDSLISSLLQKEAPLDSKARIGCTSRLKMAQINDYLEAINQNGKYKLIWDDYFKKSEVCLYTLKTNPGQSILLTGSDIERLEVKCDNDCKMDYLAISFTPVAATKWAEITKRNLNYAIAIVMDNKLLCAPIVRSQINGGNCQISGYFTQEQLRFIAAVGNNGALPLDFKFIK